LLDGDCEIGNYTAAVARQWPANNGGMVKNVVFWDVAFFKVTAVKTSNLTTEEWCFYVVC
jgi:hypothetical protein